jgi:hypothetical protein
MNYTDIYLDDDQDLSFSQGDFLVANTNEQNVELIVNTNLGSWKNYPFVGVGIANYLGNNNINLDLKTKIVDQLTTDGFKNIDVNLIKNGEEYNFYINANRDGI